ncbi:MAG: Dabb family protein [Oscillospiraceae bacterium]|nr:Dabb family protein [Oscillospiraceae bacterium]
MIRHVIMWKFKQGEEENMHKFLASLKALDGVIPEILHMEVGINCKDGNNYDACLIADFADLDALERYKNDPRHVAVSALCKSIREARGAVDFEV